MWRCSPRAGVERIMRAAFRLARVAAAQAADRRHQVQRPAPRHGDVDEIAAEVAREFPDVTWDKDAGGRRDHAHAPTPAQTLDTIVATNLHADILSDLAAALAGSPRHCADGKPQPRAQVPVHVRADPRLGLRHHGQGHRQSGRHVLVGARCCWSTSARAAAAQRLMAAIEQRDRQPCAAYRRPRRQGHYRQVTRAVCDLLASARPTRYYVRWAGCVSNTIRRSLPVRARQGGRRQVEPDPDRPARHRLDAPSPSCPAPTPPISRRMLTLHPAPLERDGIVKRTIYPGDTCPGSNTRVTPFGHTLTEPVLGLARWAADNQNTIVANRRAFGEAAGDLDDDLA